MEIPPISSARTAPTSEITPREQQLEAAQRHEQERANLRMPWPAQLDLGTGVEHPVYAEYTEHAETDHLSIKIIDPTTGAVIREMPSEEILAFSRAQAAYLDMGRKLGG